MRGFRVSAVRSPSLMYTSGLIRTAIWIHLIFSGIPKGKTQPKKVMGTTTMPNIRPMFCGLTMVPMVRPTAPEARLARIIVPIRIGQLSTCTTTGEVGMK